MKLIGKRIYLMQWTANDAKALQEMCNDKTISDFTRVPFPYTLTHAKKYLKNSAKQFKEKKSLGFAIKLKNKHTLIGSIELMKINKEHKRSVLGYFVHRNFRGEGYAVEAGKLILKFAFKKLK
ncbi:MAG: GNAT family N-acetyltransferase, partial [Candidatus Diapherotrites archaeon]|nr:GNAT family N-acetyltransferase [Candidatus Diapherotrites archaeon]